ncbi:hypothetical protein AVEN_134216-1 [Araneus ventricosus]|uniref:Uncharacterized protein n=1 Tax=Araneus ventricosus TaxID=182803 RepID=A0A4Y2EQL8_ARAVE|nr:hypothetical protein AVEN_134216-1 [Araneus ventricosus]
MIGRSKELDRELSTVPTVAIANPLFGWSNYDGNKSQTTERRNMGLEYKAILFVCFRKAYYRERVLFLLSHTSWGPNLLLFKGSHLPSVKLATSPVHHCIYDCGVYPLAPFITNHVLPLHLEDNAILNRRDDYTCSRQPELPMPRALRPHSSILRANGLFKTMF